MVSDALSGTPSGAFQSNPMLSRMGTNQSRRPVGQRLGAEVSERMREVMLGQLVREWMKTLTPGVIFGRSPIRDGFWLRSLFR
jgi:hypothetical protein